ncbi:tRNA_anti-like [Flagellimonas flava]|uniref:tRNA_anti-like n=2 Tax=Flagellimonas flava TaxID=570519 RepID=A0A1M5K073_9FLAO|nr:tRNA_anti-like [Allomuricauda flava]
MPRALMKVTLGNVKNIFGARFWFIVLVVALVASGLWFYFNPIEKDMAKVEPEFFYKAPDLISTLTGDQSAQKNIKAEKVVEITGAVKEVNDRNDRITIILRAGLEDHPAVICDMLKGERESVRKLQMGDTVKVKGIYKGFLKDAIFLNCVIVDE